jgi:hypothetical protein
MGARARGGLIALILILGAGCAAPMQTAPPLAADRDLIWDCGWRVVARP